MLEYLTPYQDNINLDELISIKKERESWWHRPSSEKFIIDKESLPRPERPLKIDLSGPEITIGAEDDLTLEQQQQLRQAAEKLIPWKKGPFKLFNLSIDAEWRSDLKWQRLEPALDSLENKKVLDIGCNNGYFLFRMAAHNPRLLLGIDPVIHMQAQFDFIQHYTQLKNTYFELFGVEHLEYFKNFFDTIFYMGIIYHHRHPIKQLIDIREALKPGGQAILETIGIPGKDSIALFPEDRYARMGNVWFIPTLSCFINWAKKARFTDIEVICDSELNSSEQRKTPWCPRPFQSLDDSLDPDDKSLTVEGYPAPRRFLLSVRKKR